MPVTTSSPAPYAPASAVLALIQRHRAKGLPSPVSAEVLARAGVSDSLIPRTLQSLQALDLLDAEGKPTEVFEGLRLASESDFLKRLKEWLNAAYADALNFVNPGHDDETAIRDAFRHYTPIGMQPRMVSLFTGLFKAAGVGHESKPPVRKLKLVSKRAGTPAVAKASATPTPDPPPTIPPEDAREKVKDEISDRALEYKLIDLLRDAGIGENERSAIWTLVQYLTAKNKAADQ